VNKTITAILIASIISAGCAHTTANPVMLAQPGDDTKSCDGLANEMQQMVDAQAQAESDRNKQVGANVALGVAGAFLIVPWFFMDTGNAATVEERAAKARYQRLNQIQIDRKCPATPVQTASPNSPDNKAVGAPTINPTSSLGAPALIQAKAEVTSPPLSSTQKLEALDAMVKKGLISQDEYNAKKQEILKTM
jgi:hypothetical protein